MQFDLTIDKNTSFPPLPRTILRPSLLYPARRTGVRIGKGAEETLECDGVCGEVWVETCRCEFLLG